MLYYGVETMKNTVTLLPSASNFIESMRSIGYSFETALCDVIDNSISAKATKIDIKLIINNNNPIIQIIDNGYGMSETELLEAMRLGSKNPLETRNIDDLGRFGLGLKSASFSQCRLLTVLSKKNNEINGYQWDLNFVAKSNKFEVIRLSNKEIKSVQSIDYLSNSSGTIVEWQYFDRIEDMATDTVNELTQLMDNAFEHIALIYHRFLKNKLVILINGTEVIPKDPFLLGNPGTQERPTKKVKIDGKVIVLHPYVLPHYTKLSSEDKRLLGKVNEPYQAQGFYLYRNKRLIVWGDYLGLARKTELGKNLRIQVDIPNSLDYLWEIDIKKSRATIPSKIKKNLLSAITDGESVSKRVNKFRGNKEIVSEHTIWNFVEDREENFHFEINDNNPLYTELLKSMNDNQKKMFKILMTAISSNIPTQKIYSEIAEGNNLTRKNSEEDFEGLLNVIELSKDNNPIIIRALLVTLINTEPYSSNQKCIDLLNEQLKEYK